MRQSDRTTATDRFLSLCLESAFDLNWLTADGFVAAFEPEVLMEHLKPATDLRAKLLVEAAGVNPKVARKKSTAAASEDLRLALQEEVCTATDVLAQLSFDEIVQWLPLEQLWQFLTHDAFFKKSDSRSRQRMLFMLEAAQFEKLLDAAMILRALTPELVSRVLPKELVDKALTQALLTGMDGAAFSAEALWEVLPLSTCLEHLSLSDVWARVIEKEIVSKTNWLDSDSGPSSTQASGSASDPASRKGGAPPLDQPTSRHSDSVSDNTVEPTVAPVLPSTPEETQARRQAIASLSQRGRLPKTASTLGTPLLLAIETMYIDLQGVNEETQQAEVIFDAFPNESQLMDAMFALAETLDPKLTADELKGRGVDAKGAVQLVLFEENKRRHRVKTSSLPPPLATSVASKPSAPPPLPAQARKASTPPPPLPPQAKTPRSKS